MRQVRTGSVSWVLSQTLSQQLAPAPPRRVPLVLGAHSCQPSDQDGVGLVDTHRDATGSVGSPSQCAVTSRPSRAWVWPPIRCWLTRSHQKSTVRRDWISRPGGALVCVLANIQWVLPSLKWIISAYSPASSVSPPARAIPAPPLPAASGPHRKATGDRKCLGLRDALVPQGPCTGSYRSWWPPAQAAGQRRHCRLRCFGVLLVDRFFLPPGR